MLRSLGHRAPLLRLVLPFIAGLGAGSASTGCPLPILLAGALIAALGALLASARRPALWATSLALAMLLAGNASYRLHREWPDAWNTLPPREAQLVLQIDRVFPPSLPSRAT